MEILFLPQVKFPLMINTEVLFNMGTALGISHIRTTVLWHSA